ncbi:MAG: transglycosylase SLT domain-containing protein [Desulfovibrio sp.]|jgi:membrane-bound lytic murein transglycosylase C|nr:transglycosylase SLT domain-containing protein [Desulfovibrio sp.]
MSNSPRSRPPASPDQIRFYRQLLDVSGNRPLWPLLEGRRLLRRAVLCLFPFLLAVLTGLFPVWPFPREETPRNSVTRPASRTPLTPAGEKAFTSLLRRSSVFPDAGRQDISRPVSLAPLPLGTDLPFLSRQAPDGALLAFSQGRVILRTGARQLRLEPFAEIFPREAIPSPETAFSPLPGQRPEEALLLASAVFCDQEEDLPGDPLAVWSGESLFTPRGTGPCNLSDRTDSAAVRRLVADLNLAGLSGRAGKYRSLAEAYARKYALAPSLVLAIMHTESNFNPQAVSAGSALGLMQIVPETAGNEVHRYLKGAHGVPSVETLFSPENNIHYGTAYLHLLARRYFHEVLNPASREMCIIAAYNGGPGAVLRLFDPDRDAAVARINALTPDQLYTALTTRMPNPETRRYVEVVLAHQRTYAR